MLRFNLLTVTCLAVLTIASTGCDERPVQPSLGDTEDSNSAASVVSIPLDRDLTPAAPPAQDFPDGVMDAVEHMVNEPVPDEAESGPLNDNTAQLSQVIAEIDGILKTAAETKKKLLSMRFQPADSQGEDR